MEENKQPGFVLYNTYAPQFEMLSLEDRGSLVSALFGYSIAGTVPNDLQPAVKMAFGFIKQDMDRDAEKYREKCEVNRENGKKGGRPKNRTVTLKTERFSEKPKKANININSNENGNINSNNTSPTPSGNTGREGFDRFWDIYPKKTGKDAAREAYNALSIYDATELCRFVERWKNSAEWKRDGGKYIKQPSRFITEIYSERVNPPDYNEDAEGFWDEAVKAELKRRRT